MLDIWGVGEHFGIPHYMCVPPRALAFVCLGVRTCICISDVYVPEREILGVFGERREVEVRMNAKGTNTQKSKG